MDCGVNLVCLRSRADSVDDMIQTVALVTLAVPMNVWSLHRPEHRVANQRALQQRSPCLRDKAGKLLAHANTTCMVFPAED